MNCGTRTRSSSGFLPVLFDVIFGRKVSLTELFSNDAHDVFGVQIGLGEDERFGNLGTARKDFGSLSLNVRITIEFDFLNHVSIELIRRVRQIVIELLVLLALGTAVSVRNEDAWFTSELGTVFRDLCFYAINVVTYVDAIDYRLLRVVVLDQIAAEESQWSVLLG